MPSLWGELDDRAETDPRLGLALEQMVDGEVNANRVAEYWMADNADFIERHREATNQPASEIRRSIVEWFAQRDPTQALTSEPSASRVPSLDTSGTPKSQPRAMVYTYSRGRTSAGRRRPRIARPDELRDLLRLTDTQFGDTVERLITESYMAARTQRTLARRWSVAYYALGATVVVLTAAAGTGALLDIVDQAVAASVTLAAAVLAALNTWLNPDAQRTKHRQLEAGWSNNGSYVERVWATRPRTSSGTDPEGWGKVVAPLEEDANLLRGGVVPNPAPPPSWPESAHT